MEEYLTLEMMLYGATAFGGSIIHLGGNRSARTELWKVISVLLLGFLGGMSFTITVQEILTIYVPYTELGKGSRVGVALLIGLLIPYVFDLMNTIMEEIKKDPKAMVTWFLDLLKRIFNLKYVTLS